MTKQKSSNDFVKDFYAPKPAKIPQNKFLRAATTLRFTGNSTDDEKRSAG
jgi:hypothetical protein